MTTIEIQGRAIGDGEPCFIVAEAGLNHNGLQGVALALIEQAAHAGVDAIKFQTQKTEEVMDPEDEEFEEEQQSELDKEQHAEQLAAASTQGISFLSTPFDEPSVDLLDDIGVSAFKVGSGELTHFPLLRYIAEKGKPMIVSTGMAGLPEIDEALKVIRTTGNEQIILLHCVSMYPAAPEKSNVRAIQQLKDRFGVPVGFSDHSMTDSAALAAVTLGACLVEKHFSLAQTLPGGDHEISYLPEHMKRLVQSIREIECALGNGDKVPYQEEVELRDHVWRGIYAREFIPKGTVIQSESILIRRPKAEIQAREIDRVIGKHAISDIAAQEPLSWSKLSD
jgi:N,N'-diacetyllegionaminate synthase